VLLQDDPRLRDVLMEAVDLPPERRDVFLDSACGCNAELRREIESLLASLGGGADQLTRPPAKSRPDRIGRYRIIEVTGEGGMGTVFKAEQREPVRRIVALKVIKLGLDTKEVIARFQIERQALALMNHPNIAGVLDAGNTNQGQPYFVMEFVAGVPITRYCDDARLTTRERLELFLPVCNAVQHAHHKGIIHRDLKPANILVRDVDAHAVPKIIDFGIAKATNHALVQQTLFTRTGSLVGTPEYMSPEQAVASGLDVDTRADIYSLGVLLYELLTGALPFDLKVLEPQGPHDIARVIRDTEPSKPSARLRQLASKNRGAGAAGTSPPCTLTELARRRRSEPAALMRQLRGDLDVVVLKAIDKDRTRRYETAAALATDVRRYLDDEPVLARPPSPTYLLRKRLRRHRRPLAFLGALLFIIAVLFFVFGIRLRRDQHSAWVLTSTWISAEQQQSTSSPTSASRHSQNFYSKELPTTSQARSGDVEGQPEVQSTSGGSDPTATRPSQGAADSALPGTLSVLRLAIDLYEVEHGGYPAAIAGDTAATFVRQLTKCTDATGASNAAGTRDSSHPYGPYMFKMPSLPVGSKKGAATVRIAPETNPPGVGPEAWIYYPASGRIKPNLSDNEVDTAGTPYNRQ
jgi:serine/threonine protein kinase